jgi:putative hydrolase of the HAD superfamily
MPKKLDPIQAISFDAGGTLIEPQPSVGHVYALVAKEEGFGEIDPGFINQRFNTAWRAKTHFDYSLRAWAELVDQTFAQPNQPAQKVPFFQALYDRFRDPKVWRIYDDVFPTLERLQSRGLKLALISNWDERLLPLLHQLNLAPYFQTLVVSHQIGAHKPAPEIFRQAVKELQVPSAAVLHVGDSEFEDFHGAIAIGMNAVLISRNSPHQTGSISTLLELERLLISSRDQPSPKESP